MTFVILGATGDLAARKLYPALSMLDSKVIGISRRDYSNAQFRAFVKKNSDVKPEFLNKLTYFKADLRDKGFLKCLPIIKDPIFYLAVSYEFIPAIIEELKRYTNAKIVLEKPFGYDLKSSESLDKSIQKVFPEKGIYRIDHYLGKETVQNLLGLRFSNPVFEAVWNNKFISHIHIISEEQLGVENRLEYYDKAGAIKDMVQSHLLQVASLVLMDSPKTLDPKDVHDMKVKVLRSLKPVAAITGQYKGYKEQLRKAGIRSTQTETYAEVKLKCTAPRWKGTPIIVKTGKKLRKKQAYIEIEFKKSICKLYCNPFIRPNRLIFHIQPSQDVNFQMNTLNGKKVEPIEMQFCHSCAFGSNSVEAYYKLLSDVIKGDMTLFPRSDEIRYAWRIADSIKRKKPIVYLADGPKSIIH
ncbi:MAG: glucose-6-phosphate dehydrogenase (NADP(+)) [Nanoarchaeota archaeon]|nr:glucose-6-phosphate dehydrogenase (NADP(+)) [Nanoarchaeota archaeon]MBU1703841.1 glucose-6-phosphate dehydrogenase (NADP(+)) [Nanoarchaeota archaeon]